MKQSGLKESGLKEFLKSVDRSVLNRDTRAPGVSYAYMAVAVLLLLHHVYVTLYHKLVLTGARDLYIPFIIFAGVSFFLGKLWKDKLFWVFAALLVLKVARTAMFGSYALTVSVTYFVLSVYAFFICYAIARVLPRKMWKPFLSVLCFLWTAAALVYAAFGLKVALTGVPVRNLGTEFFIVNPDHRLYLIYHAVSSGVLLSACMSVAVLGCILAKNRLLRMFYAATALVLFVTCSLTGTRTAFVMSGLNLALLLFIPLRDRLQPDLSASRLRSLGKRLLLAAVVVLVTGAVAFLQPHAANLLPVVPAKAEEAAAVPVNENLPGDPVPAENAPQEINVRDFSFSDEYGFLNGRFEHWGYVLRVAASGAKNLLLGQSVYKTMDPVNDLRASEGRPPLNHCHNTFLQHLTENGLPALLLYTAFIAVFLFHAYRVLTDRGLPFWQRALPVCAVLCVAEGFIDNTCHVNFGYLQMSALYLFAGFTVTLSRERQRETVLQQGKS